MKVLTLPLFDYEIFPKFSTFFQFVVSFFLYSSYSLLINCIQVQLGALTKPFLCLYSAPCLFSHCAAVFNNCKFPSHFRWILITCYLFRDGFDSCLRVHCVHLGWVHAGNANLAEHEGWLFLCYSSYLSCRRRINLSIDVAWEMIVDFTA